MSNVIKQSARQQAKSISERLGALEQGFTRFLVGVNQRLQGGDQRLAVLEETVAALVELNGEDEVSKVINEKRIERARKESIEEKAKLETGIAEGYVLPAEKVEERSIVIGRHIGKDGNVAEPGRVQLVVPSVIDVFKAKLLGSTAGAKIDMPDGNGVFEVQEIYSVDDEKYRTLQIERQKAAQEAALAAAKAAAAVDEAQEAAPAEEAPPAQAQE